MNNVIAMRRYCRAHAQSRQSMLASWHGALKMRGPDGVIPVNHASYGGKLLETYQVASIAYAFCPPEPWFDAVREYLLDVIKEEESS